MLLSIGNCGRYLRKTNSARKRKRRRKMVRKNDDSKKLINKFILKNHKDKKTNGLQLELHISKLHMAMLQFQRRLPIVVQ